MITVSKLSSILFHESPKEGLYLYNQNQRQWEGQKWCLSAGKRCKKIVWLEVSWLSLLVGSYIFTLFSYPSHSHFHIQFCSRLTTFSVTSLVLVPCTMYKSSSCGICEYKLLTLLPPFKKPIIFYFKNQYFMNKSNPKI